MFKLKLITGKINEEFNMSAINTDLNSFLHQKNLFFKNSFILKNKQGNIYLDQYIESNKEEGLSYITGFYNKLFNNDISYSKEFKEQIIDYNNYENINISLKNSFYFSMKKPSPEEISSSNYKYSSRIIKEIIEEFKDYLLENEELIIEFSYGYTNYSKIMKNILFGIKMIFQNEEENNELFSSYTDKLQYIQFNFNIYTNSKNIDKLKNIINKNILVYGNKFNNYEINKSYLFKKLHHKLMIDSLVAQSLIIPIHNYLSTNNKTKIIPYSRNIVDSGMVKTNKQNKGIIFGKINQNNIIEETKELYINKDNLKNSHQIITGQTGAGKSFGNIPIITGEIIKSSNEKKISKFICIDPNSSMIANINIVLGKYNNLKQKNHLDIINYQKEKNYNIFISKKLVFNPLLVKDLFQNIENVNEFNNILNFNSELILESIKGVHNESSFGANNEMIIKSIVELLILLNSKKYENIIKNNK